MRERRIVKRTRENGSVDYVVEERKLLFGKVIFDWYTAQKKIYFDEAILKEDAIFRTIEEAQRFCGINTNPIVKREIVK